MARLMRCSREQLEAVAQELDAMAAKIRAADPDNVRLLDSNRVVDYQGDPHAEKPLVAADSYSVRVEWIDPVASDA